MEATKTIEKFLTGFLITIIDKNWKKIGNFATPCDIAYKGLLLTLYNDHLVQHQNGEEYVYTGLEFEQLLPQLLEHGELLPKELTNAVK